MFNLAETDSIMAELEDDVRRLELASAQLLTSFDQRSTTRFVTHVERWVSAFSSSLEVLQERESLKL